MPEKSKVFFSDFRTSFTTNLLQKLQRLMRKAGVDSIDMEDKSVAIKTHCGEPGNLAFLRPNWAKAVADLVAKLPEQERSSENIIRKALRELNR